jgi:hypothetical protein
VKAGCQLEKFESDDECTICKGASIAMENLEPDLDSGMKSLIAEVTSGVTIMSEAPYWEAIVITDAAAENSILAKDIYLAANEFAAHG